MSAAKSSPDTSNRLEFHGRLGPVEAESVSLKCASNSEQLTFLCSPVKQSGCQSRSDDTHTRALINETGRPCRGESKMVLLGVSQVLKCLRGSLNIDDLNLC